MFVVLSFWIITKCTISFTLLITHAKKKRSERCRKRQRACLILNSGSDRVVFAC